jgi:anti-sigma factor RsiW
MKKDTDKCNPVLLNRFFDGEARDDEHARISQHLRDCPFCRKSFQKNQTLSLFLKAGVDRAVSQTDFASVEDTVLRKIRKNQVPWGTKIRELFASRRFLIPAAAMATLIFLVISFTPPHPSVSGPSAIVSSVTGDISSVMIIETPGTRQTIIWFNENF